MLHLLNHPCQKRATTTPAASFDSCQLGRFIFRIIGAKDLGVGIKDQFPAVLVPLPFGDQLVIDPRLPQPADEYLADVALRKVLEIQAATGSRKGFPGILDVEKPSLGNGSSSQLAF